MYENEARPHLRSCGDLRLCLLCLSNIQKHLNGNAVTVGYTKLDKFKASVILGCDICCLLWDNLTTNEKRRNYRVAIHENNVDYDWFFGTAGNARKDGLFIESIRISCQGYTFNDMKRSLLFTAYYTMSNDRSTPQNVKTEIYAVEHRRTSHGVPKFLTGRISSEETSLLGRFWIQECISKHEKCTKILSPTQLPSRLIYINQEANETVYRLCLTESLPPDTRYCTLSHRWGQESIFCLTSNNLTELQSSIPRDQLSQTFVDALEFCKKLGIDYFWIDSLCIVQDSRADWTCESATMGDIYRNSWCNISADGYTGKSNGLFGARAKFSAKLSFDDGSPAAISWIFWRSEADLWREEVEHSALNRRAWVLQERLLAPRIIHFGKGQCFWECRERVACETRTGESKENVRLNLNDVLKQYQLMPTSVMDGSLPQSEAFKFWRTIVNIYSTCLLSKPEDKLIALSGIATYIQNATKCRYIAGLWMDNIMDDLLWRRGKYCVGVRPQAYRAPSWTWASVDCPVGWHMDAYSSTSLRREDIGEVLSCRAGYNGASETGQVHDGILQMKGRLWRSTLKRWKSSSPFSDQVIIFSDKGRVTMSDIEITLDVQSTGDADLGSKVIYIFLLVIIRMETVHFPVHIVGLLLERERGVHGHFSRIGLFVQGDEHGLTDQRHPSIITNNTPASLLDSDYEQEHGSGIVTISVI